MAVWFVLIQSSKILTLDNSEFYFCKICSFAYCGQFEENKMENKSSDELMELIPADIRHHFVLRKRLIDSWFYWSPKKRLDFTNYEPRKRSEFNQLQLELEKLKSHANTTIETEHASECVKVGTNELVYDS